jgi:hypothetical protein
LLEVVAGKSDKFKVGDRVNAQSTWSEYVVLKDDAVMPSKYVLCYYCLDVITDRIGPSRDIPSSSV